MKNDNEFQNRPVDGLAIRLAVALGAALYLCALLLALEFFSGAGEVAPFWFVAAMVD